MVDRLILFHRDLYGIRNLIYFLDKDILDFKIAIYIKILNSFRIELKYFINFLNILIYQINLVNISRSLILLKLLLSPLCGKLDKTFQLFFIQLFILFIFEFIERFKLFFSTHVRITKSVSDNSWNWVNWWNKLTFHDHQVVINCLLKDSWLYFRIWSYNHLTIKFI